MGALPQIYWRHVLIRRIALILTCLYFININYHILPSAKATTASGVLRSLSGNGNHRLPRTSASQLTSGNSGTTYFKFASKSLNTTRNGNLRIREQQLLNIFDIFISTLEGKLKRVDSLDKTVDEIMQNMDVLQNRVADNIEKTDLIISQLNEIGKSISNGMPIQSPYIEVFDQTTEQIRNSSIFFKKEIVKLDGKVTDIDNKLEVLKVQIDNNFLQVEDFNGEASEKKPVTINVSDITKALSSEAMTHVSSELSELRDSTNSIDKKLQFHINIVSENIAKMISMIHDIHFAVVDSNKELKTFNLTTEQAPIKSSKLDILPKQKRPMVVSEKIDEVWDVVVDTKSTVDNLLPKSAALLTQTQRQERAIDEIHQDLKTKTNLIINNLDMVEKRLKKHENYVQKLANLPDHSELLPNGTFDSFSEQDTNNRAIFDTTLKPSIMTTIQPTTFTSSTEDNIMLGQLYTMSSTVNTTYNASKTAVRKDGIIFPSIKKKPAIQNNTVFNDVVSLKDYKIYPADFQRLASRLLGTKSS
ncbi:uncharacterized protein LOC108101089 isoform X2 [Drosophila ficusphila]|uniref:uncharacterized protein LOC108101089 isoform X2 n=1 Tax=Drosophila ficusphila TaxID=30025 RepID=UPI001C8ABFC4|nr:uncharacterized protein LOC108101089 isoform X2 [Drosophila ficusphila]